MSQKHITHLAGKLDSPISIGAVAFASSSNNQIEAQGDNEKQIINALHLLYFSANAHKIYYGLPIDPLSHYFKKESGVATPFFPENLDITLLQSFSKLLLMEETQGDQASALRIIQAIKCLNESTVKREPWHEYLLLGKGFEVLFSLNPAYPSADLRQHLRPLLHLKFSHPVELLWKWVDQFYASSHSALAGERFEDRLFLDNPNIQAPLLLIAEKLLVFSIYDALFSKNLLEGDSGTPSIPDDFRLIHSERVLVYFWTHATLEKKIALLNLQQNSERDVAMLNKIKEMHQKLQEKDNVDSLRRSF